MQRSSRPSPLRSHVRRAAVVGVTVLTAGVLAAAPAAAGGSWGGGPGHGGGHGPGHGHGVTKPTPKPKPTSTQKTTAAYVYKKKDASQYASWPNSTQQYLVTTWPGEEWRDLTLEQIRELVPVEVCGPGWGVQEDMAHGGPEVFTESPAPHYPDGVLAWENEGGPLFRAKHWDLEEHVGKVPDCGVVVPTPLPTPTTTPTPKPTPTTPAPQPTVTPTVTPTPTPTPTVAPTSTPTPTVVPTPSTPATPVPTPTPSVTSEVLDATPTPTPTPSATVRSEVLAAGDETLATTGSTVVPFAIGAGVLVAAGVVLVALRQRRRTDGADA